MTPQAIPDKTFLIDEPTSALIENLIPGTNYHFELIPDALGFEGQMESIDVYTELAQPAVTNSDQNTTSITIYVEIEGNFETGYAILVDMDQIVQFSLPNQNLEATFVDLTPGKEYVVEVQFFSGEFNKSASKSVYTVPATPEVVQQRLVNNDEMLEVSVQVDGEAAEWKILVVGIDPWTDPFTENIYQFEVDLEFIGALVSIQVVAHFASDVTSFPLFLGELIAADITDIEDPNGITAALAVAFEYTDFLTRIEATFNHRHYENGASRSCDLAESVCFLYNVYPGSSVQITFQAFYKDVRSNAIDSYRQTTPSLLDVQVTPILVEANDGSGAITSKAQVKIYFAGPDSNQWEFSSSDGATVFQTSK